MLTGSGDDQLLTKRVGWSTATMSLPWRRLPARAFGELETADPQHANELKQK